MRRIHPEKIGCGAVSLLLGSTSLAFFVGSLLPGMTAISWIILVGSNFLLWMGLLAFIQGHKEDIEDVNRVLHEDVEALNRVLRETFRRE